MSLTNTEIVQNINNIDSDDLSQNQSQNVVNSKLQTPKITYIIEPSGAKFEDAKRIIAIAYSYDDNYNVKYGASIFRKINKTDICVKSKIRETATDRFYKFPVSFSLTNISDSDIKIKHDYITKQIRYKMYKYGVKGREDIYNSLTCQNSNLSEDANSSKNSYSGEEELNNKYTYLEPRISYILEPKGSNWQNAKRIIAVVYSYTKNQISYGACIFRRTFPNEACVKANIRNTALERFYNSAVLLERNNPTNENINVRKVLEIIRKTMYTIGVKQNNDFVNENIYINV